MRNKNLKEYWVYILTNKSNTLYVGITSNLRKRISQHKNKELPGFTAKYNIDRLIFYESFASPAEAIAAEKRIKGWSRKKKIELIKTKNKNFKELTV